MKKNLQKKGRIKDVLVVALPMLLSMSFDTIMTFADRLFLCFRINPGSKTRLPSRKRSEINTKGCIESIARRCATKPVPQTIAAKSNKVSPSILLSQSGVFFIGRIIVCLRLFWASQVKFFYSGGTLWRSSNPSRLTPTPFSECSESAPTEPASTAIARLASTIGTRSRLSLYLVKQP